MEVIYTLSDFLVFLVVPETLLGSFLGLTQAAFLSA